MKLGAKIFGVLSGILLLYLLFGFLLPSTWEARAQAAFPYPPSEVFPYLNRMDRWVQWNALPESGAETVGPEAGVGAGMTWDDPQYGKGQLQILASITDSLVAYEVKIEGGSLQIHGSLSLQSQETGTLLSWVEQGDFGWNPLMGYAARGMGASQAEAMRWNFERLRGLLEGPGQGPNDP